MKEIIGTSNRVLEVDLGAKSFEVYTVSESERQMYLGGKGLGLKLVYDRLSPGADPLGPDNILAFMPGVLMGTGAPCSGRFAAVTKSPLTGLIGTASCGGPFGMQLKTAGWDGLLIRGSSETPLQLIITAEGVEFKEASALWGKGTTETQQLLGKKPAALVIGPAGENLVRFANVASGHRFLGRTGMGAVMGAKKLKAVLAMGKEYKIVPARKEQFDRLKKKAQERIKANPVTSYGLRNFGTASLVNYTNVSGILPVRNFTNSVSDNAYKITGEYMSEKHELKNDTCQPCSILCGKKGTFNGRSMKAPEYETLGLLGSNLDVFDAEIIARWNEVCGELGMDTISAGGTIAWVMEAAEKGLVKSDLRFGSPEGVEEALNDIAHGRGLGREMALGSRELSRKHGGQQFAMQVKGLELSAYDPRGSWGLGLGYATANRGACHLSSTLMANEIFLSFLDPHSARSKADWVKFQEDLFCCINSIKTCLFTTFAYIFEHPLMKYNSWVALKFSQQNFPVLSIAMADISLYNGLWSSITGLKMSRSQFLRAGERIHVLERYMNTREGVSADDDTLPDRLLHEGRGCDPEARTVPLEEMKAAYYKLRGYDGQGKPTPELMKKLEIEMR